MFCSYCGNRLPEGARFCSMCGSKVAVSVEMADNLEEPIIQNQAHEEPEVIVDEAAVARAEAKATAAVPPVSREVPATQPAAPVRTRIAFDWSTVKDEPQKKQIPNVKSPWDETGGFDEEALYKEMTPSTDRSRTMNFIDVLKAERNEEKKAETPAAPEADKAAGESHDDEPPRLHFAPLYNDFDTPVKTPFDEPAQSAPEEIKEEPETKPYVDKASVHKEDIFASAIDNNNYIVEEKHEEAVPAQTSEKPSWHWFEMPDFLKSKESAQEPDETESAAPSAAEFKFHTLESALFEEPRYEDIPEEPEAYSAPAEEANEPSNEEETNYSESDYSEYEEYDEYADYTQYDESVEPAAETEPVHAPQEEPEAEETPLQETEAYTYIYDEQTSDENSDYSDYINMDMGRAASDDEISGRAALHAEESPAEAELVEEVSEPVESTYYTYDEPAGDEQMSEPDGEAEPVDEPAEEPVAANAEEVHSAGSQSLERDLADIIAAGAVKSLEKEDKVFEEPEAELADEAEPVDEEELFAEIEETSPKKKGMTIAAPAEEESEVESLKRRLAELTGAPETVRSNEPEIIKLEESDPEMPAEPEVTISEEIKNAEPVEPELITIDETEAVVDEAPAEAEPELISLEPAEAEPEVISAEAVTEPVQDEPEQKGFEQLLQAVAEPEAEEEQDPVLTFEDELSRFLSDTPEADDKTPVYGLTPFSELEEELREEAETVSAEDIEPEVITLTGPEPDAAAEVLEAISEAASDEEAVSASSADPLVRETSGVIDLGQNTGSVSAAAEQPKATDALSLEDLETDLFGETPSPDADAEVTKKIDKFYTLYRKNEEFQRLLDEEYSKLKTESHPAAVEPSKPAPAGTPAAKVREVEDVTIYQELTPEEQKALAEAEAAQAAKAEVQAAVAAAAPQPAEVKPAPVEWDQVEAEEKAASKKESRKEKKERKKREQEEIRAREAASAAAYEYEYEDAEQGSVFLTVVAVIIAILLVILLAIILVLNFAPDSGIALQIDSVIENITSHFSTVDNAGGQYLL